MAGAFLAASTSQISIRGMRTTAAPTDHLVQPKQFRFCRRVSLETVELYV